jgi:membrane-associated protease RseP (regulator of RpoE activity)
MSLLRSIALPLLAVVCAAIPARGADEAAAGAQIPPEKAAQEIRAQPADGAVNVRVQAVEQAVAQAQGVVRVNAATSILGQPPIILVPSLPFQILPNLVPGKDEKPGYLGVQLDTVADDTGGEKRDNQAPAGVGVLAVVADSPAAKAGLEEGDHVVKFEGKPVKDSTQLRELIRAAKAGSAVTLTVRRKGKEVELKPKLGPAPDDAGVVQVAVQNAAAALPGVVEFDRVPVIRRPPAPGDATEAGAARGDLDVVQLRDGNVFRGKVRGLDPERGLILKREDGTEIELLATEIRSLAFAEPEKAARAGAGVKLQLRDGSRFASDSLTMEAGRISIALPDGQRLEVAKEQAFSATLGTGGAPEIYDGPLGIAGWTSRPSSGGVWDYKDGWLRCQSNGAVGRDFESLPDPVDVSFEVNFPPQLQMFTVSLFAHGISQSTAGTLSVQFGPQFVSATHFDGRRYNRYSVNPQNSENANAADPAPRRYRVLVDRVKGRALIYMDGIKRAEWELSKVKAGEIGRSGGVFSLSPNVFSSNHVFQVGRIRILPWDGKEPVAGAPTDAPATDAVIPAGGAAVAGKFVGIREREILLDGERTIPRDGTLFLRFGGATQPPAVLPPAAGVVRLVNRSEFPIVAVEGERGGLRFTTRLGSQIRLPLSSVRSVELLPPAGEAPLSLASLDVLTLTDGSQLRGRLVTPIRNDGLQWKIAAAKTPFDYATAQVAGVVLSPARSGGESLVLGGTSAVRFANGDWLPASIVSLDATRAEIETGLAARLAIPVRSLRSVYFNPEVSAAIADGSSGREMWMSGWNGGRPNVAIRGGENRPAAELWSYHDGSYALRGASRSGAAALSQQWAAAAGASALSFEILNPSRNTSFNVRLFNLRGDQTLSLHCYNGRATVYFNPGRSGRAVFGGGAKHFQLDDVTREGGGSLRIGLILDRPERTFRLLSNEREVGKVQFKDDDAREMLEAAGMVVTPMYSSAGKPVRIGNLWRGPWEGRPAPQIEAPVAQEPEAPGEKRAAEPAPPVIYLANGDEFAGSIEALEGDVLKVNSEAGLLELPRERVAWIRFPVSGPAPAAVYPRLRFHDRGLLSVQGLEIGIDRVKCRMLDGQPLEFPLSLVKEIVWRSLP